MDVLPCFLPDPESEEPPRPSSLASASASVFLFVGRLERIKGLDDVILAFARYQDADLVVAGDGDHAATLKRPQTIPGSSFSGESKPHLWTRITTTRSRSSCPRCVSKHLVSC